MKQSTFLEHDRLNSDLNLGFACIQFGDYNDVRNNAAHVSISLGTSGVTPSNEVVTVSVVSSAGVESASVTADGESDVRTLFSAAVALLSGKGFTVEMTGLDQWNVHNKYGGAYTVYTRVNGSFVHTEKHWSGGDYRKGRIYAGVAHLDDVRVGSQWSASWGVFSGVPEVHENYAFMPYVQDFCQIQTVSILDIDGSDAYINKWNVLDEVGLDLSLHGGLFALDEAVELEWSEELECTLFKFKHGHGLPNLGGGIPAASGVRNDYESEASFFMQQDMLLYKDENTLFVPIRNVTGWIEGHTHLCLFPIIVDGLAGTSKTDEGLHLTYTYDRDVLTYFGY